MAESLPAETVGSACPECGARYTQGFHACVALPVVKPGETLEEYRVRIGLNPDGTRRTQ